MNRDPEPPVQVNQVDSCFHRTLERVGLTLYDDPEGQYCTKKVFSPLKEMKVALAAIIQMS